MSLSSDCRPGRRCCRGTLHFHGVAPVHLARVHDEQDAGEHDDGEHANDERARVLERHLDDVNLHDTEFSFTAVFL